MAARMGLLILATLSALATTARADRSVVDTFLLMQNGFAPVQTESARRAFEQRVNQRLNQLNADSSQNRFGPDDPSGCDRYFQDLRRLIQELRATVAQVDGSDDIGTMDESQFLIRMRLRLLIPAFFGLHSMFKAGLEGGYGELTTMGSQACPLSQRDQTTGDFLESVRDLSTFSREGLGNPGFEGFDQIDNRLLALAHNAERHAEYVSMGTMAATTVASLAFWELAPVSAMFAAEQIFGVVPAVMLRPAAVFGIRTATLTGEGLAYNYIDRRIEPSDDTQKGQTALASWEEQMHEIENIVASPMNSPEFTLLYLDHVRAQLAVLYQPWIATHLNELKAQTAQEVHLDRTLGLIHESMQTVDLSLSALAAQMARLIQAQYGYNVSCVSGWNGPLAADCVMALKKIARALYSHQLPGAVREESALQVFVTAKSVPSVVERDSDVQVYLSTRLSQDQIASILSAVLVGDPLRERVFVRDQFKKALESFQANLNLPVSFDENLTMVQKWKALDTLTVLAQANLPVFAQGPEQMLFVTFTAGPLREVGLNLELELSAFATVDEISENLTSAGKSLHDRHVLRDFVSAQKSIEFSRELLKSSAGLSVTCTELGFLTSRQCAVGLSQLVTFFSRVSHFQSVASGVVIEGGNSNREIFLTRDEQLPTSVLHLRYDFDIRELEQFSREKGWL